MHKCDLAFTKLALNQEQAQNIELSSRGCKHEQTAREVYLQQIVGELRLVYVYQTEDWWWTLDILT